MVPRPGLLLISLQLSPSPSAIQIDRVEFIASPSFDIRTGL
jgi:hypothetical protein